MKQDTEKNFDRKPGVIPSPSDKEHEIKLLLVDKINLLTGQELNLFLSRALQELNLQLD